MKIEVDTVKGFQDYMPEQAMKRQAVKRVIEKHYKLYGFMPIETPFIEFDELIRGDNLQEDEAVSERFRLKDRAGRNLGLRYEFTFQLSRIFKQNPNMKLPFRRYQIGEVFRDEPTSSGRFKQFTQCDCDIVGESSMNADAEVLMVISDILKELNIDAEININNRKLLSSIIDSVEIDNKNEVMKELDKLDKIGEDQVKMNLKKYTSANQIVTLFKILEKSIEFFKENKFDGADELDQVIEKCADQGVKVKFSPFMIRGLSYYTGNIFEVKVEGKNSIAGGGRYDKVVGKYLGRDVPAVGISFGLERISELANIKIESVPKTILISIDKDKETEKLAKKLRKAGISCVIGKDKVGKELEYANSYGINYAVFIGDKEIDEGKFNMKDMKSGKEEKYTEKQLIKKLS